MNITDDMVTRGALVARSWGVVSKHGEWTNEETQQQCARDIIEAVAPLIAAKALREAAEVAHPYHPVAGYTLVTRDSLYDWLRARADRIERGES